MIEEQIDDLLQVIPKEQAEAVFNQRDCDIEPIFLGFTEIYKNLAKIIPEHFTVIDLGCAYNAQSFCFPYHKQVIAVDVSDCIKFRASNCKIFEMTIEQFIKDHLQEFDLEETFAICSYVPPWGGDNIKMVREAFKNVFAYYPHGGKYS